MPLEVWDPRGVSNLALPHNSFEKCLFNLITLYVYLYGAISHRPKHWCCIVFSLFCVSSVFECNIIIGYRPRKSNLNIKLATQSQHYES